MGIDPVTLAAIISAAGSLGSAAITAGGKDKGKVEPEPLMIPGMTEGDYKRIMGKAEGMATQQYVAPINDLMKFAYSIPLQHYMGMSPQDITIPGIAPFGGGMGGLGGAGTRNWNERQTISQPQLSGYGAAPWMRGGGGASWMNRPGGENIKRKVAA